MSSGTFHGTYDPEKVIVTVGSFSAHGFVDGTFISAKRDADRWFKTVGIDGEFTRAMNISTTGTISITLSQNSSSNDDFSKLNVSVVPFDISIKDLSGKSIVHALKCWVKNTPDFTLSKDIEDRTWVFDCGKIAFLFAGSNNNSLVSSIMNTVSSFL